MMRAHFGLPSVTSEDAEGRPPIHVHFEIPYFTVSGVQVMISYSEILYFTVTGSMIARRLHASIRIGH